jgi:Ca2+-binding EF-hand superfamily protein
MRKKTSSPMTLDEAEAALEVLDTNGDGVIDFQEFVSWFVANESKREE